MFKQLLTKFKTWRETRRMTVECHLCKLNFHAKNQSGLCPHLPIKEFIYGHQQDAMNYWIGEIIKDLRSGKLDVDSKEILDLESAIEFSTIKKMKGINQLNDATLNSVIVKSCSKCSKSEFQVPLIRKHSSFYCSHCLSKGGIKQ